MRPIIVGAVLVLAAAGGGALLYPPGRTTGQTYPLTVAQATAKLGAADVRPGKWPFARTDVEATRPSPDVVRYVTDTFDGFEPVCEARFTPADDGVLVATSCEKGDPADAIGHERGDLMHVAFDEFVDAALTGRPFDDRRITAGQATSVMSNLPAMQRQALETKATMDRLTAEGNARAKHHYAEDEEDSASEDWGSASVD
jgi:hypothetical protein